jgi:hypothetical protein
MYDYEVKYIIDEEGYRLEGDYEIQAFSLLDATNKTFMVFKENIAKTTWEICRK